MSILKVPRWTLEKIVGTTVIQKIARTAGLAPALRTAWARVQQDFRYLVVYVQYAVGPAYHLC